MTTTLVHATLIKLSTDDGLCTFEPGIALGRRYLVDLATIRRGQAMVHRFDNGQCLSHTKDIIFVADAPGWLPLECVRLEA